MSTTTLTQPDTGTPTISLKNIPDYDVSEVTPEIFAASMQANECMVIRNVIPKVSMEFLYHRTMAAYIHRDEEYRLGKMHPGYLEGSYKFGHVGINEIEAKNEEFLAAKVVFVRTKLLQLSREYFKENVGLIYNFCNIRRQKSAEDVTRKLPFHQDAIFIKDNIYTFNFWIPMTPCGKDAPGLEVVRTDNSRRLITPPNLDDKSLDVYDQISHTEEWVAKEFGKENFWHPELNTGDVLVMSNFTLHRTHHTKDMQNDRLSFEMRVGAITPELKAHKFAIVPINVN